MRLKAAYGHHLVRILRLLIPVLILASIAVLLRNYLENSSAEPAPAEPARRLGDDQSELTEGLRYFTYEGDRPVLSVAAARTLGYKDGKDQLEGVLVEFYGDDGLTPEQRIAADRCDYVQSTGKVDCRGDIRIHLDEKTTGYTSRLEYEPANEILRTLAATRVTRPAEFEAHADRMVVRMAVDEYVLDGGVEITTEEGAVLDADRVVYRQGVDRVDVIGGARVSSGEGELRGPLGRVQLAAGTFRPVRVILSEGASAVSFDRDDPGELSADRLVVELAEGVVRSVRALGRAELVSGIDPNGWTLSGERIDGAFDPEGRVSTVQASDGAEMVLESGQRIRSEGTIRNEMSGRITTTRESLLELAEFRVRGRDFEVEQTPLVDFRTEFEATIETPEGFFKGGRTEARFDPETGVLLSLSQSGGVEFLQAGRSGSADRIEVQDGGSQIHLIDRARVEEANLRMEASEIRLNPDAETFTAMNSVRAWSPDPEAPFVIFGGQARGDGGRVSFSEDPEMWWAKADAQVSAMSIDIDPESRSFLASGDVAATIGELRVWSEHLEFDDAGGRVEGRGGVRTLAEDLETFSDRLEATLIGGEPDHIVAQGGVRIRGSQFRGVGERADYTPSTSLLILTGEGAEVSNAEMGDIRGDRLEINLETQDVAARADEGRRVTSSGVSP